MGTGQGRRHSADAGSARALQRYTRAVPRGGVVTGCSFITPNTEDTCTKGKMKGFLKMQKRLLSSTWCLCQAAGKEGILDAAPSSAVAIANLWLN